MAGLRVLWFSPDFWPQESGYANGIARTTLAVVNHCSDVSVTVVTPRYDSASPAAERLHERVEVVRFPPRLMMPRALRAGHRVARLISYAQRIALRRFSRSLIAAHPSDLLVSETLEISLMSGAAVRELRLPLIVRVHGCQETEHAHFLRRPAFRFLRSTASDLLRHTTVVGAIAPYYLHFIQQHYLKGEFDRIFSRHYAVLPYAASIPEEILGSSPEGARDLLGLPPRRTLFVQVGRMNEMGLWQKGFEDTICALARLVAQNVALRERCLLVLIGDGERRGFLQELARRLGVSGCVCFTGQIPHGRALLHIRAADVVVAPSRYEGGSVVGNEALHCGKALVATATGGLIDLVRPGVNGLTIRPFDTRGLAEALKRFIEEPDLAARYGKASAWIADSEFSDAVVAAAFRTAFDLALTTRSSGDGSRPAALAGPRGSR